MFDRILQTLHYKIRGGVNSLKHLFTGFHVNLKEIIILILRAEILVHRMSQSI